MCGRCFGCDGKAVECRNISNDYSYFYSLLAKLEVSPLEMIIESRNLFGMNLN